MISRLVLSVMVAGLGLPGLASAQAGAPIRLIKTFDGQVMRCEQKADAGRVAYRLTSTSGEIVAGNVALTIGFETLKCVETGGTFSFERAPMGGRLVNPMRGFVEFSNLEFVAYTPDFKTVLTQSVSLNASVHQVNLVAPVSGFSSLLPRNIIGNAEKRVVMFGFLRGPAKLGDADTGVVRDRTLITFGTNSISLSDKDGSLTVAR